MTREKKEVLRKLFIAHGGSFFGPNVEHAMIPETQFWMFLDIVVAGANRTPPDDDRPMRVSGAAR